MLWIEVTSSTVQAPYQLGIQIVNNRQILDSASLTRQATGGQVDLVPLEIIEQGGKPDFNLPGMKSIGTHSSNTDDGWAFAHPSSCFKVIPYCWICTRPITSDTLRSIWFSELP